MSIQQFKQKHLSRLNWTSQQQAHLKLLKETQGIASWTSLGKELNKNFPCKNRSGKQCRERYMNYAKFSNEKQVSPRWTVQEYELLFEKFFVYGRKWVQISKQMPGKSENCIKNRFYGAIRKMARRINKIFKQKKIKQKKILKHDIYIRILQGLTVPQNQQKYSQRFHDLEQIKNGLIRIALIPEEDLIPQEVIQLGNKINQHISSSKAKNHDKKLIEQPVIDRDGRSEQNTKKTSYKCPQYMEIGKYLSLRGCGDEDRDEQSLQTDKNEEKKYLMALGLDYSNYNSTVSQDLEKEVSQILNKQDIESSDSIIQQL